MKHFRSTLISSLKGLFLPRYFLCVHVALCCGDVFCEERLQIRSQNRFWLQFTVHCSLFILVFTVPCSRFHCFTVSLFHPFLLLHCFMLHCFTLFHCFTVSLCHCSLFLFIVHCSLFHCSLFIVWLFTALLSSLKGLFLHRYSLCSCCALLWCDVFCTEWERERERESITVWFNRKSFCCI